uniref:Protein curvature thylakoid chloroplastic-like n=2 Tax=Tetraselmis sp. GSL018 TaxID=582737 RepID=A0A061SMW2_9CHLO
MAAITSVSCRPLCASVSTRAAARPSKPSSAPQYAFVRPMKSTRSTNRLVVRAEAEEGFDPQKFIKEASEKWEKVENKSAVAVYGGGALALVWFSSTIVSAINAVPLLPKMLELVGLGYTAWFVYRYLLFKSSREELIKDVDELKKRITGTQDALKAEASKPSSAPIPPPSPKTTPPSGGKISE